MSQVIISGNTSGSCTLTAPDVAGSSVLTLPVATDTLVGKATTDTLTNKTLTSPVINGMGSSILTSSTVQNALTTAVLFPAIPSWAKRITVMLNGVSTTSTGLPTIRLGTASSIENTGYTSSVNLIGTASVVGQVSQTSGFELVTSGLAASLYSGNIILTNITANTWIISGSLGVPLASYNFLCAGNKTLAGELTQLQLTTTGGTDTFDAGSINIMWE